MTQSPTKIHRIPAGTFSRNLISTFALGWISSLCFLALVGVILAFAINFLWLIAVFFILLVLLPFMVGHLYYVHALTRECFVNTFPHTVDIADDTLIVTLYTHQENPSFQPGNPDDSINQQNTHSSKGEQYSKLRDEVFTREMIKDFHPTVQGVKIHLCDRHQGFLLVPADAFLSDSDFNNFTTRLNAITNIS